MAITLVGVGPLLASTSSTTQTITLPTGMQAGDLIILQIACGEDSPQPALTTEPSGYNLRGTGLFNDYGAAGQSQWIYWKIHSGSESNPSFTLNTGTATGGGIWGVAMAFRGVHQTDPFALASPSQGIETTSSTTFTPPDVTTEHDDSMIVSLVQSSDDNNLNLSTANGYTLSAISGTSYQTTVGSDAAFGMAYKLTTTAGTYSLPTWNQQANGPDYWAWQTLALRDANSVNSITQTVTADAYIQKAISQTLTADAYIQRTLSGSLTADAQIAKSSLASLTGDAYIQRVIGGSVTADSYLSKTISGSLTGDAYLLRILNGSFSADAHITGNAVEAPVWVSPSNGSAISATPTLVFTIPNGPSGNYHFHIQLDKVNTFDGVDLRDIKTNADQTGWEYYDGATWTAFPSGGVASTYAGNDCRYTVQSALSNGTWYRRVRGGK